MRRRQCLCRIRVRAAPAWMTLPIVGPLVLGSLVGCHFASERAAGERLWAAGELLSAHAAFERIADDWRDPQAAAYATQIARQLARECHDEALSFLARGYPEQAYQRLTRCLTLDPSHPRALALAHDLHDEALEFEDWCRRYRAAVDHGRWEDCVDLGRGPQLRYFRWPYRGRWAELAELAWTQIRQETEGAPDAARLRAEVARAREFLDRFGAQREHAGAEAVCESVLPMELESEWRRELANWCERLEVHDRVAMLCTAARTASARSDAESAVRILARALFLLPESAAVRELYDGAREDVVAGWSETLAELARHERWGEALAVARRLRSWGGELVGSHALDVASLERRHAGQLVAESAAAEAAGRVGLALVQRLRARALDSEGESVEREIVRLRGRLRLLAVVRVVGSEAAVADDASWIRCGEPEYDEQRRSLAFRQRSEWRVGGTVDRENPAHALEQTRWLAARELVERLYLEWQSAAPGERGISRARYESALCELTESRERLERMDPRERRVAWEADPAEVETRELIARLDLPVEVRGADRGRVELLVSEHMRITDRTTAPGAGVPGDPDELPTAASARKQLEDRCQVRVRELLRSLELEERRNWLERATEAARTASFEDAVDLAVKVIVSAPTHEDLLRAAAIGLLVDSCAIEPTVAHEL
ncbi:MAG: hypothetical protein AB7O52_01290 [Planctomycetota bacterium]